MTNIRRRVFKPRTVQLLAMLLEAGMDGATTKHLSECLGARYPENQRHFIARNTAALLSGMRGKYVELVEKGVWRVCIVPPVTPVTYARKARLSSYDRSVLLAIMKADSRRGITLSDLSEQNKNFERETSLDDIAKSVAQLMVYDCLLQVTGTYAFYYAFGVIKPISSEAPKPTPEPSPPPKPTFAEGPTFTRLRIKPEQRKMLQVVYRAGKDGVTIQEIAQVLGRKTANGITSTLSALAERGCVHQLDVHSQRWYYGPRNRASA